MTHPNSSVHSTPSNNNPSSSMPGGSPVQTNQPLVTAARNKAVICKKFYENSYCPLPHCPYAHISKGDIRVLPPFVCPFFLTGKCLKDSCPDFHAPHHVLSKLKGEKVTKYKPEDVMPILDPLEITTESGSSVEGPVTWCPIPLPPRPAPILYPPSYPVTAVRTMPTIYPQTAPPITANYPQLPTQDPRLMSFIHPQPGTLDQPYYPSMPAPQLPPQNQQMSATIFQYNIPTNTLTPMTAPAPGYSPVQPQQAQQMYEAQVYRTETSRQPQATVIIHPPPHGTTGEQQPNMIPLSSSLLGQQPTPLYYQQPQQPQRFVIYTTLPEQAQGQQ